MVPAAGFEPATPWFEAKYSNPLSYAGVIAKLIVTDVVSPRGFEPLASSSGS